MKKSLAQWFKLSYIYFIEILLILLWALWVGKEYLNFDPNMWPYGREFAFGVRTHIIWENLKECGTCVFWNGSTMGGSPAFAELQGGVLNPIVIITTLLAGVVNGSKLVLLFSLFLAGLAQWWLAKSMQVGRLARLWSAGMAVVGGHLAGRMELGLVGLVFSTAFCSLAIASSIDLALTGRRRSAIILGIILAMAITSGQVYVQVGFLFGIVPSLFILIFDHRKFRLNPVWKEFFLAGVIAVLLAGVFLVPLLHFLPNIGKPMDAVFGSAQSLGYVPLNLVINNLPFYFSTVLTPTPYPNCYIEYLGWIPVILALLALRYTPRNSKRLLLVFLVAIGLIYLASSAILFKWLETILPNLQLIRITSYIAGLANPIVLCMAACGLEGVLKIKLPNLAILNPDPNNSHNSVIKINSVFLILLIPLFFSLKSAYEFGQNWLINFPAPDGLTETTKLMNTESTEWVTVPYGDHYWNISVIEAGLKLGNVNSPWFWKDRTPPPAYLTVTRDAVDINDPNYIGSVLDLNLIINPENEYAYVQSGDQKIPCSAHAVGGNIDVTCPDSPAGTLIVMENNWNGWKAKRDNIESPLLASNWLSVDAPAGTHTYSFRYKPWDVWVGLGLTLLGIAGCIYFGRKGRLSSTANLVDE